MTSRKAIPLERGKWQDVICDALNVCGFDKYGTACNPELDAFRISHEFSDNISAFRIGEFELKAYYWGDESLHPDCANRPNFYDSKTGLEVYWYKYALRSAVCNQELTFDAWCAIWKRFQQTVHAELARTKQAK